MESKIAIDSSGFSSSKFTRWHDEKYGTPKSKAIWLKAHCAVGCRTNVITAADVLDQDSGDMPQFTPLAKETDQDFPGRDYVADKAYTSTEGFQTVADLGGTLFAPFKNNTTGGVGGIFQKMYHLFCLHKDEYFGFIRPKRTSFSPQRLDRGASALGFRLFVLWLPSWIRCAHTHTV